MKDTCAYKILGMLLFHAIGTCEQLFVTSMVQIELLFQFDLLEVVKTYTSQEIYLDSGI